MSKIIRSVRQSVKSEGGRQVNFIAFCCGRRRVLTGKGVLCLFFSVSQSSPGGYIGEPCCVLLQTTSKRAQVRCSLKLKRVKTGLVVSVVAWRKWRKYVFAGSMEVYRDL